jgi:hypothetical protein
MREEGAAIQDSSCPGKTGCSRKYGALHATHNHSGGADRGYNEYKVAKGTSFTNGLGMSEESGEQKTIQL